MNTETHDDRAGTQTLEEFARADVYNAWLTSRILPALQGQSVLEIGCGLGNITRILDRTHTVTAVDIREDYTRLVADELGVATRCVDLSRTNPFSEEFDDAVCLNVLEHIEEEGRTLSSVFTALKPGGHFAVLVPAFNWLFGPVDRAIHHKRRYTRRSLRRALEQAGFVTEKTFYFNAFGIPGWFWQNRIRKHDTLPGRQLALFNKLVPVFRLLDIPFRPFFGISVVAWARKPGGQDAP